MSCSPSCRLIAPRTHLRSVIGTLDDSLAGHAFAMLRAETIRRMPEGGKRPAALLELLRTLLQRPHLGIAAIGRQQLRMRTALDDAASVHHQNFMRVHHRG